MLFMFVYFKFYIYGLGIQVDLREWNKRVLELICNRLPQHLSSANFQYGEKTACLFDVRCISDKLRNTYLGEWWYRRLPV